MLQAHAHLPSARGVMGCGFEMTQHTNVPAHRPPPPLALTLQPGSPYSLQTIDVSRPQLLTQAPHSPREPMHLRLGLFGTHRPASHDCSGSEHTGDGAARQAVEHTVGAHWHPPDAYVSPGGHVHVLVDGLQVAGAAHLQTSLPGSDVEPPPHARHAGLPWPLGPK